METDPMATPPRRPPMWLWLVAVLAFACTCNLAGAATQPPPSPYPTYTPYPTNTPSPSLLETAEQPPAEQPTVGAPAGQAPTKKPPIPKPTATTEVPPPPPGGGSWGLAKSDIEVSCEPVSVTRPDIIVLNLKNNGPSGYTGTVTAVIFGASAIHRGDPTVTNTVAFSENLSIEVGIGTIHEYVHYTLDPLTWMYPQITCTVGVPDNRDPNPDNNTGGFVIP